jgi:hypothetical protein
MSRTILFPKPVRRYFIKTYILDLNLYPNRLIEEDLSKNHVDGIYIDFLNTTANLNNIDFSIDESDWFPATLGISGIEAIGYAFARLRIRWSSSEDGKRLVLIYAGEQTLRFTVALQTVDIVRDDVGLAKDSTLQLLTKSLRSIGGDSLLATIYDSMIIVPVEEQSRYKPPAITLYSGTVTSNGNTADVDVSTVSALELLLKVTGVSGTNPSLSVYVEGKFETTGDYKPLVWQEGITSTGVWFFTITQLIFRYLRVRWVVGGTSPSFTFTVVAQAMV